MQQHVESYMEGTWVSRCEEQTKENKKATLGCIYNCNLADLAVDTAYHTALCTYSIYASTDVDNEAV